MDKNISTLKRRIKKFVDYKGLSNRAFYKEVGWANGVLASPSGLTEDSIYKFLDTFPEVNPTWLLTGEGSMIMDGQPIVAKSKETGSDTEEAHPAQPIPLVPIDALAGFGSGDFSIQDRDIKDRYLVPDFVDVDFMIRVRGSSMYPKFNSGDVVACRVIKERSFIQWNKAHLIDTHEQGAMIKRVRKGKEGGILAVSDNPDYEPFEIPEEQIRGLALITGVIRLE